MTELEKKLTELLNKHGICVDCGEMFSHDIDAPFASCKCKQSEWHEMTPYMELELKLKTQSAENIALVTNLHYVITRRILEDQEVAAVVPPDSTEERVDKVKLAADRHVKLIAAKTWSNLEDVKGRAAYQALDTLLNRCCPVSGHVINDPETRKVIEEERDKCLPKCGHPECK